MKASQISYSELSGIRLYIIGDDENQLDSMVTVKTADLFREDLPFPSGCYDAHMGTTAHEWPCASCGHTKKDCPGHSGVVNMRYPVMSPLFIDEVIKWLKVVCFNCGQLLVPYRKMQVPQKSILDEYVKLLRSKDKNIECPNAECRAIHPHVDRESHDYIGIQAKYYKKKDKDIASKAKSNLVLIRTEIIYPHMMAEIFEKIKTSLVLQMGKPIDYHPRKFILYKVRAPPNTIRPDIRKLEGGRSNNNDATIFLQGLVKTNSIFPKTIPSVIDENLRKVIHNMGLTYFEMIKGHSPNSAVKRVITTSGNRPLTAIARRLGRKHGRVRRNLLGKRILYMARSFIVCEPLLPIDTIGVPLSVCKNIHIPVTVQHYNMEEMQLYLLNGTERYPGCSKIKKRGGKIYSVSNINRDVFRLEIGDVVYRNIIDDDVVNFNRPPSLEVSSITSLKIKVMHVGDVFRMNVSLCAFFNADFDGDAMTIQFPRSTRTKNEINRLASPEQFFIAYKNSASKVGQVQDGLIGMALATRSAVSFDKFHAMYMFCHSNVSPSFGGVGVDARISGREIVSMLLKTTGLLVNIKTNASFYKSSQASFRSYSDDEINVVIDRGQVKSGVLDKSTVGQGVAGGLYHIIHNRYGPKAALDCVWQMQQVALAYLGFSGWTVGLGDVIISRKCTREIYDIEQKFLAESREITDQLNRGKIIPPIGKTITEYYEESQIEALKPGDEFIRPTLVGLDPDENKMYQMIFHESRGKQSNLILISSAIGQLTVNGERMPENFGGRTLPYYTKFDSDPASRGYIPDSFMSGEKSASFFAHCMEARYLLIQKALSTSITGMQNRMAIKNLESMILDNLRRVSKDGSIIQVLYGDDGVDPRFLERVVFPTIELSDDALAAGYHADARDFGKSFSGKGVQVALDAEFDKIMSDRQKFRRHYIDVERSGGLMFSNRQSAPVNIGRIISDVSYNLRLTKPTPAGALNPVASIEKVRSLCANIAYTLINEIQEKKQTKIPPHIWKSCGLLRILIRSYLCTKNLITNGITDHSLDLIIAEIRITFGKSLMDYGKCVGIIAAQCVSEPMTQTVLNSHHSTGTGSAKKQGMFRVIEICGAKPTSRMRAASMLLRVVPEYVHDRARVQEIANHIEMLPLSRFITAWQIFFEKYGAPVHPLYKHETDIIKEFDKYNIHIKPPSDLAPWCIRFALDKQQMILKSIKTDEIYSRIRGEFPFTHIVYSSDNSELVVFRIYVRNIIAKRGVITTAQMTDLSKSISNTVIRGVDGVRAAYVQEQNITVEGKDGSIKKDIIYNIFTDGTNIEEILTNPYIDPTTVQSDSVMEMAEIFGIEAAKSKIINELRYQVDGPSYRHYTIYAAEMTYTGTVTSIDRFGSVKRNTNFMTLISDASPLTIIKDSALASRYDGLSGVSPSIMVGKNPRIGDLFNSFCLNEKFVQEHIRNLSDVFDDL